jgi:hypothetical protein
VLNSAQLAWEKELYAHYTKYGSSIADIIWANDAAVVNDALVAGYFKELNGNLPNGLPARYAQFKTKAGIATYIADTINFVTVRHEIIGTSNAWNTFDHRYGGWT